MTNENLSPVIDFFQYMPLQQVRAIAAGLRGEEKAFFQDTVTTLARIITTMPKTRETDGQGDDAIAYLHYFMGGFDWYITERDMEREQLQAFGLADMGCPEVGYISIVELIANGVELDLHWTPKPLKAVK